MAELFLEFPRRDFPRLTHFGYTEKDSPVSAGVHAHYGYEIVYFSSGHGMVSVGEQMAPIPVTEDDVLITTPDFVHTFAFTPAGRAAYYWLGFQTGARIAAAASSSIIPGKKRSADAAAYLEETESSIDDIAQSDRLHRYAIIDRMPEAKAAFEAIRDELTHKRSFAREMIHLKTVELITHVFRRLTDDAPVIDEKMSYLSEYLKKNYAHPISLAKLGELAALNPSYVSRRFKEVFGVSPIAYLTAERLSQAKRMLAAGKSATAAAHACGFSDVHYFSAVFKSAFNSSPTEYARVKNG